MLLLQTGSGSLALDKKGSERLNKFAEEQIGPVLKFKRGLREHLNEGWFESIKKRPGKDELLKDYVDHVSGKETRKTQPTMFDEREILEKTREFVKQNPDLYDAYKKSDPQGAKWLDHWADKVKLNQGLTKDPARTLFEKDPTREFYEWLNSK